jgi:hypothetical protein
VFKLGNVHLDYAQFHGEHQDFAMFSLPRKYWEELGGPLALLVRIAPWPLNPAGSAGPEDVP